MLNLQQGWAVQFMARQQSRATILAEIEALQKRLEAHDKAQAERIGKIAVKAGLAALDLNEAQLSEAFADLARRFRKDGAPDGEGGSKPEGDGASEPDAKPAGGAKKAHAGAH
ncbi:TraC family protein [Methylobacterium sp. sgz302541]|uniref:TraC family protein n=1 Tax=unclassified Methylobacterium TaxID=2615210 RepID=UPI003D348109